MCVDVCVYTMRGERMTLLLWAFSLEAIILVYVRECMYLCACVCVYIYIFTCVFVCMYVHVR